MHWQFVIPGYLVVFGGLVVYAVSLLHRIRSAASSISEAERTFLD